MTGKKPSPTSLPPETEQAESVQEAIAMIEALKRRKQAQAAPKASGTEMPTERGRPPKLKPDAEMPGPQTAAASPANTAPASPPPAKRGRRAESASADSAAQPSFGVSRLSVHRPLGLLEVHEKADLDALLADPRLSPHIAMRLDDRFALVLPASLERLQSALLKVGHTPRLAGSKGDKA